MSAELFVFRLFALLAVTGGFIILFSKNLIRAAFALLLTLLSVAAIFVFAAADFLAVVQILLYAGGILVLIIFGAMLTKKSPEGQTPSLSGNRFLGLVLFLSLSVILIVTLIHTVGKMPSKADVPNTSVSDVGKGLIGYLLPFELLGVLLTAVLVGAVLIAGRLKR